MSRRINRNKQANDEESKFNLPKGKIRYRQNTYYIQQNKKFSTNLVHDQVKKTTLKYKNTTKVEPLKIQSINKSDRDTQDLRFLDYITSQSQKIQNLVLNDSEDNKDLFTINPLLTNVEETYNKIFQKLDEPNENCRIQSLDADLSQTLSGDNVPGSGVKANLEMFTIPVELEISEERARPSSSAYVFPVVKSLSKSHRNYGNKTPLMVHGSTKTNTQESTRRMMGQQQNLRVLREKCKKEIDNLKKTKQSVESGKIHLQKRYEEYSQQIAQKSEEILKQRRDKDHVITVETKGLVDNPYDQRNFAKLTYSEVVPVKLKMQEFRNRSNHQSTKFRKRTVEVVNVTNQSQDLLSTVDLMFDSIQTKNEFKTNTYWLNSSAMGTVMLQGLHKLNISAKESNTVKMHIADDIYVIMFTGPRQQQSDQRQIFYFFSSIETIFNDEGVTKIGNQYITRMRLIRKHTLEVCTQAALRMITYSTIFNQYTVDYQLILNYAIKPRNTTASILEMEWYTKSDTRSLKLKQSIISTKFPRLLNGLDVFAFLWSYYASYMVSPKLWFKAKLMPPVQKASDIQYGQICEMFFKNNSITTQNLDSDDPTSQMYNSDAMNEFQAFLKIADNIKLVDGNLLSDLRENIKKINYSCNDIMNSKSSLDCFIEDGRIKTGSVKKWIAVMRSFKGDNQTFVEQVIKLMLKDFPIAMLFSKKTQADNRDISEFNAAAVAATYLVERIAQEVSKLIESDYLNKEDTKSQAVSAQIKWSQVHKTKSAHFCLDFTKWNSKFCINLLKQFIDVIETIMGGRCYESLICEIVFSFFQNKTYVIQQQKLSSIVTAIYEKQAHGEDTPAYLSYKQQTPTLLEWLENRINNGLDVNHNTCIWAQQGFAQGMFSAVSSVLGTLLFKKWYQKNKVGLELSNIKLMQTSDDCLLSLIYERETNEQMLVKTLASLVAFFADYGLELSEKKCNPFTAGYLVFNSTGYVIDDKAQKIQDPFRELNSSCNGGMFIDSITRARGVQKAEEKLGNNKLSPITQGNIRNSKVIQSIILKGQVFPEFVNHYSKFYKKCLGRVPAQCSGTLDTRWNPGLEANDLDMSEMIVAVTKTHQNLISMGLSSNADKHLKIKNQILKNQIFLTDGLVLTNDIKNSKLSSTNKLQQLVDASKRIEVTVDKDVKIVDILNVSHRPNIRVNDLTVHPTYPLSGMKMEQASKSVQEVISSGLIDLQRKLSQFNLKKKTNKGVLWIASTCDKASNQQYSLKEKCLALCFSTGKNPEEIDNEEIDQMAQIVAEEEKDLSHASRQEFPIYDIKLDHLKLDYDNQVQLKSDIILHNKLVKSFPNMYMLLPALRTTPMIGESLDKYIVRVDAPMPWIISQHKLGHSWVSIGLYQYHIDGRKLFFMIRDSLHLGAIEKVKTKSGEFKLIRAYYKGQIPGYPTYTSEQPVNIIDMMKDITFKQMVEGRYQWKFDDPYHKKKKTDQYSECLSTLFGHIDYVKQQDNLEKKFVQKAYEKHIIRHQVSDVQLEQKVTYRVFDCEDDVNEDLYCILMDHTKVEIGMSILVKAELTSFLINLYSQNDYQFKLKIQQIGVEMQDDFGIQDQYLKTIGQECKYIGQDEMDQIMEDFIKMSMEEFEHPSVLSRYYVQNYYTKFRTCQYQDFIEEYQNSATFKNRQKHNCQQRSLKRLWTIANSGLKELKNRQQRGEELALTQFAQRLDNQKQLMQDTIGDMIQVSKDQGREYDESRKPILDDFDIYNEYESNFYDDMGELRDESLRKYKVDTFNIGQRYNLREISDQYQYQSRRPKRRKSR